MKLLLIENDQKIAAYVAKGFRESGDIVDAQADGNDGLAMALEGDYDLLIVDLMLPGRDGLSVIEECIELYDYVAEEKSIRLNFESCVENTTEQTINADPIRLRQVLANLLVNAIKHTPEGGLTSVQLSSDNRNLNISIKDSGSGITEQDQPLIFDRLFRAQSCRSKPGMGLGLTLVKAIIEAHKGSIRIDSALDKGSCFSLVLPFNV